VLDIIDNAYKAPARTASIGGTGSKNAAARIIVDTAKSYGWYDITVRAKRSNFEKRFAGHIESGAPSKTDPFMGRI
jgi:phospholipase C